jgi:hypothetical protein
MATFRLFFNGRTVDIEAHGFKERSDADGHGRRIQFMDSKSNVIAQFNFDALKGFTRTEAIVKDEPGGTE